MAILTIFGATIGAVAGNVFAGCIAKRIDPAIENFGRSVLDGLSAKFPDNHDARRAVLVSATKALEKIALAYEYQGDFATNQAHRKEAIPFRQRLFAWTKKLRAATDQTLNSEEIEALQNAIHASLSEGLTKDLESNLDAQRVASTSAFREFVVQQLNPPKAFLERFDGKKETRGFFAAYAELIARELKVNSAFHSVFQDQVLSELRGGMVELLRLHNSYLRERLADERDAGLLRIDDVLDNPGVSRNRPTSMVMAKYRLVDYVDATGHLAGLMEWTASGTLSSRRAARSVAGRMYVGPGGLGKTRTLIELSERLDALDWNVVWVGQGADPNRVWRALDVEAGTSNLAGLLVVLDYAETKQEALSQLCKHASKLSAQDGPPIRILAVSRHAGEWWKSLLASETGFVFENVPIEFSSSSTQLSLEHRKEIFENALSVFQSELEFFGLAGTRPVRPNLASGDYERPLSIMFGAYLAARGERLAEGVNLLKEMVEQERLGWQRYIGDATQQRLQRLERVVPPITFMAGGPPDLVLDLVRRDVAFFGETSEHVHQQTLRDLIQFYGENDRVGAIEPDILGEAAIAYFVLEQPSSGKLDWLVDCINFVCQPDKDGIENSRQVIEVFIRALSQNPDAQVGQAFSQILLSLQNSIENGELDGNSLLAISNSLPSKTDVLANFALVVVESIVNRASEPQPMEQRAWLLGKLSNRLSGVGRVEEALAVCEQAVELYRTLATSHPEVFKPNLANSLNMLAAHLSDLGRREKALDASKQAVTVHRELASKRSNGVSIDLAISLGGLSNQLSELGYRKEAFAACQEAVDFYSELVSTGYETFTPILAMGLNNLSNRLSDLDQHQDALAASKKAVGLYRKLVCSRRDAFRPDLALALNNLSHRYSKLDEPEKAFTACNEAVEIYRELVRSRPVAFKPNLAIGLGLSGECLKALGKLEEAIVAYEEASRLLMPYVRQNPDRYGSLIMQNASDLVDVMTLAGRTEHQIRQLAVQLNLVPPHLDVVKGIDMERTWAALRNRGEIEFAKIAYRELVTFLDAQLQNQELDRIRASVGAVLRTLGDDCPYTPPPKQNTL